MSLLALTPRIPGRPGQCAPPNQLPVGEFGVCIVECRRDADCQNPKYICCYNGCGNLCMAPQRVVTFGTNANVIEEHVKGGGWSPPGGWTNLPINRKVSTVWTQRRKAWSRLNGANPVCVSSDAFSHRCTSQYQRVRVTAFVPTNNEPSLHISLPLSSPAHADITQSATTEAPKSCSVDVDIGPCRASIQRFFFNARTRQCESFTFGGCGGNGNNYASRGDCELNCMPQKLDAGCIDTKALTDNNGKTIDCLQESCPAGYQCSIGTSAGVCCPQTEDPSEWRVMLQEFDGEMKVAS